MQTLYDWAVGPLAWLAFGVFLVGSVYRLWSMYILAKKKDGPFWAFMSWKYALRSLAHWIVPTGAIGWRENPLVTVTTFVFHISLLVAPIFLMGHVVLFDAFRGWSWPTLPDGLADIMAMAVVVCCLIFAWRRIALPEVRFVTSAQDWLVLALVFFTFLTGVLAYHQVGGSLLVTTLHILCGEAMLAAIPFTRLSHMLFAVFSRGYIGSEFGGVRRAKDW